MVASHKAFRLARVLQVAVQSPCLLRCPQVEELRASLAHQANVTQQLAAQIEELERLIPPSYVPVTRQGAAVEACQLDLQGASRSIPQATSQGEMFCVAIQQSVPWRIVSVNFSYNICNCSDIPSFCSSCRRASSFQLRRIPATTQCSCRQAQLVELVCPRQVRKANTLSMACGFHKMSQSSTSAGEMKIRT